MVALGIETSIPCHMALAHPADIPKGDLIKPKSDWILVIRERKSQRTPGYLANKSAWIYNRSR